MRMTWLEIDGRSKLCLQRWYGWVPYDRDPYLKALRSPMHPEIAEHIGELTFSDGWFAYLHLRQHGWTLVPPSVATDSIWGRIKTFLSRRFYG